MDDYKREGREIEAPFNMAIATLKRLDIILQQIRQLYFLYPQGSNEKQRAYIDLVKQFYLNAIPLLDTDDKTLKGDKDQKQKDEKLGKEILAFQMESKSFVKGGVQRRNEIYSQKKEIRLNEILCQLQSRLKRFFMPGKRDAEGLI